MDKCNSCRNKYYMSECKGCKHSTWSHLRGNEDKYLKDCKCHYPVFNMLELSRTEIIDGEEWNIFKCPECGRIEKQLNIKPINIETEIKEDDSDFDIEQKSNTRET